jgi:hypothetical protein
LEPKRWVWLLRAAGRYATGKTFEETVLARLDALGRDLRQVKGDVRVVKRPSPTPAKSGKTHQIRARESGRFSVLGGW